MEYKVIDMETYPRRDQFELFNSYAYPYMGLTVNVDITDFLRKVKEREVDFFLSFCWCIYRAANAVTEFKHRIKDGRIVEYPEALMSTTLSMPDGNYCYCDFDCKLPFDEYLPKAKEAKRLAIERGKIEEYADVDASLFCSCVPWLSYSALVQPVPQPADSNPRITWGKYFEQNGRTYIPLSTLCNHALMDGRHLSMFYAAMDKALESF
ncbi:MAG: chloramphenicol acetyltransferase [Oscillospiraceae bacterium]|nr:chloramphenicol acetyltransferase [Oscillospiraceae bacterium]